MRTAGKLALAALLAAPLLVVGPNSSDSDTTTVAALGAFSQGSADAGRFHLAQAPELEHAITAFWERWHAGDQTGAVRWLKPQFGRSAAELGAIRSGVTDRAMSAGAWMDAGALWDQAMAAAVDMLWHQSGGAGAAAWADRQRLVDYAERALASGKSAPKAGDEVIDFLDDAKAAFDRWIGLAEATSVENAATVTGTPAGHNLTAVVDGSLDMAYLASVSPVAGDGMTVGTPRARPTDRVVIVGSGAAMVEARAAGVWRRIGSLRDGYTELPTGGQAVEAVRLNWTPGSIAPRIHEIVFRSADVPAAHVVAERLTVDATSSGTLRIRLASTQPYDTVVRLTVEATSGLTVSPHETEVVIQRGAVRIVELTVAVAANTATGRYDITFTVCGLGQVAEVTAAIDVRHRS